VFNEIMQEIIEGAVLPIAILGYYHGIGVLIQGKERSWYREISIQIGVF
jgi:hypothetical protein